MGYRDGRFVKSDADRGTDRKKTRRVIQAIGSSPIQNEEESVFTDY